MGIKEVKEITHHFFDKLLVGYNKKKTYEGFQYIKTTDSGFVGINPIFKDFDDYFYVKLAFSIRYDAVSDVMVVLNKISDEFKNDYPTLSFGIKDLKPDFDFEFEIRTDKDLENHLNLLKSVVENEWLALTNRIETVKEFEKEINRLDRPTNLYCDEVMVRPFVGFISAYVTQVSNIDFWKNYYFDFLKDKYSYDYNQYLHLVDNVDTLVKSDIV